MATQQKYPSEVKESLLLKALQRIAIAKKENRLSWDRKTVYYISQSGQKYKKSIDEMPKFFLEITGTSSYVEMLAGDVTPELKDIFVKVLETPIGELDTDKLEKEIHDKIQTLREMANNERDIEITKQIDDIKELNQGKDESIQSN